MKIAFIVTQFPLLSETFILNQITGLIDRGHKVDIFAKMPGNFDLIHEDVHRYNLLESNCYFIDSYYMVSKNKIVRLDSGARFMMKYIHKNPIPLLNSVNFLKYGKQAASLGLLFKIMPFLEKGPYDIIHTHYGPNGNFGTLLKDLKAIKGKVITTFHGYDMSKYIRNNGDDVYDYLFVKGDLFLPISEYWKDSLIKLGCSEHKIIVHRMGVDTNKFRFIPRKQKNNEKVQLLTIARLVEKKGLEFGIRAVAKVMKKHSNLEYRIVGDGSLRYELEELVEDLKIVDKVKLLGWKQQEEIVELMRDADILLAPSVTAKDGDQEGIPVVLMEALAQGLPVLSTRHSGIPELVQDGISGFLIPEKDVDGLAEKLLYLIKHQEIWPEMGRAGRVHVERNYDINKLNDRLVELYQQLLRDKVN